MRLNPRLSLELAVGRELWPDSVTTDEVDAVKAAVGRLQDRELIMLALSFAVSNGRSFVQRKPPK